jgi:drug/metabolite transporter (DMT)-like permease
MGLWHKYAVLAYLAVMLGVVGHASSEFFSVLSGISGPELAVWRFLLGGAGLIGMALCFPSSRDLTAPFKTDTWRLLWLSALGVTLGYLLFQWSLDFATIPQVATMVTTIPIFVGIANSLQNKQAFTLSKIITGLGAVLGVALLITDGYLAKLSGSGQSFVGVLMAMGCAAAVASYAVMIRPVISKYGALRITAITMSLGAIGLWIVVGVIWNIWVNPMTLLDRPANQLTALLILGFWNTTITQFLWIGGLAAVPDITRGGYLFFFKPVIAAGLAILFLHQSLTKWQFLAIAIICSSVLFEIVWSGYVNSAKRSR